MTGGAAGGGAEFIGRGPAPGTETLAPLTHLTAFPAKDDGAENFFPHPEHVKDTLTVCGCDIVDSESRDQYVKRTSYPAVIHRVAC